MTLRKRTLYIIGAMFLGLIIALFFVAQSILLSGYEDMPRDIFEQVQSVVAYLILVIVGFGVMFGLVTIFLLEKQVISRLSRLSKSIDRIGKSGDISARIPMKGTDELSNIADTINDMLTALQQSEAELHESEERYRRLAENATDVIWTTDMSMRFTYVSPSVTQMLGFTVEEIINRPMQEVFTLESFEIARKVLNEELAVENVEKKDLPQSLTLELRVNCKDGSIIPVEVKFTFLSGPNGRPFGILAIARDITERKQAEKRLQELYKDERDLRQKLQAEINKRVEFTRALVHEIKSPLTPLVTSSELLLEELKEEPALGLVRSINRGAYNLNQRIDELLDLARGEVGMLRLSPASVDPVQLLQEIADVMVPVAHRNSQSLNLELPQSLPSAWADEDRLRQVILNLINNAIKFTPAGGKITLRAKKDGANLIVEVQDTGPGIRKKDQRWLFEPYYQLGGETARRKGLGLGLSLSKKLVELHGGCIWVNSQKGKGSIFGFSIPLEATNKIKQSAEAKRML